MSNLKKNTATHPKTQPTTKTTIVKEPAKNDAPVNTFKHQKVLFISLITLVGTLLCVLYHYNLIKGGKDYYPFNTFLFSPNDRFRDFTSMYDVTKGMDPYSSSIYFPFTHAIMALLTFLSANNALFTFNITFTAFFIIYTYIQLPLNWPYQKIIAVIILSAFSYPFLYVIDRGNLEAWVFMSMVMFIYFYLKKMDILAALFLSMAISFKLFPALFGLFFIIDKRYRLIVYTATGTIFLTLLSAAIFKGGVMASLHGQLTNISAFNKLNISSSYFGLSHNASIMVPLKLLYYNILVSSNHFPPNYEVLFNRYYLYIISLIVLVITFVILRYKIILWKKIALITFTFILLQQVSYDYKLIHVFIPLYFFLNNEEPAKSDLIYVFLFGLLLIPKDYVFISHDFSISSVINPIIMTSMIVTIIVDSVRKGAKVNLFRY